MIQLNVVVMKITDDLLELAGLRAVYEEGAPGKVIRYEFSVKKKKPKKRKKSKDGSAAAKNDAEGAIGDARGEGGRRSILWGNVDAYYFKWGLGYCSVPAKGGTPCGLGEEDESLHEQMSIDRHQMLSAAELLMRAQNMGITVSKEKNGGGKGPEEWDVLLETRQRDFKKSNNRNPLYGPLTEEERVVLLSKSIRELGQRSHSMGDHGDARVSVKRSGSIDSASTQSSLNNNDTDEPSLTDLNRELRNIRESRDQHMGCSCRPIKIDKLSVVKMKTELMSNHGFEQPTVEDMSKSELASTLKGSLKDCPLCTTNNCICVQLEIECRADTCECLRRREIQSCANPYGTAIFDSAAVSEYRAKYLGKAS